MIEVQNLTKRYGTVTAVDDISFRVENGAKSSGSWDRTAQARQRRCAYLTGYMPATDGKAIVAGFDVFDAANRREDADGLSARKRRRSTPT